MARLFTMGLERDGHAVDMTGSGWPVCGVGYRVRDDAQDPVAD